MVAREGSADPFVMTLHVQRLTPSVFSPMPHELGSTQTVGAGEHTKRLGSLDGQQQQRVHIVIRRPEYVSGTRERPEVGVFTQAHAARHPRPWGHLAIGERLLMKWSGGPIVAEARIQGFRQFADATSAGLRSAVAGYGLHDLDAYWRALPPQFSAVVIFTEAERWLSPPIVPRGRSYGESWVVLRDQVELDRWLTDTEQESLPRETPPSARGSRSVPPGIRFEVLRRADFSCSYCGRSVRVHNVVLHVDHVLPWRLGGTTVWENLTSACQDCNLGKGGRPLT